MHASDNPFRPFGKLHCAARRARSHVPNGLPPLFMLTDPARYPDPVLQIAALPTGMGVIYRHFGARNRSEIAKALRVMTEQKDQTLLIANDPALALKMGADGVHWPEKHMHHSRKWAGQFAIMTASAHSFRAIHRANALPLNGLLVSTVFPSRSPSASRPMSAHGLAKISHISVLPIYGLGGVTAQTAPRIAGFAGLAGVSFH